MGPARAVVAEVGRAPTAQCAQCVREPRQPLHRIAGGLGGDTVLALAEIAAGLGCRPGIVRGPLPRGLATLRVVRTQQDTTKGPNR